MKLSTKSQEAKDRCEEQNQELKGLRGEENVLGGSKEMLCEPWDNIREPGTNWRTL